MTVEDLSMWVDEIGELIRMENETGASRDEE